MELLLKQRKCSQQTSVTRKLWQIFFQCRAGICAYTYMYTPALKLPVVGSRIFNLSTLTLNHGFFSQLQWKVLIFVREVEAFVAIYGFKNETDWNSWRRMTPTSTVQLKRAKQKIKSSSSPFSCSSLITALSTHYCSTTQTGISRTTRPVFTIQ